MPGFYKSPILAACVALSLYISSPSSLAKGGGGGGGHSSGGGSAGHAVSSGSRAAGTISSSTGNATHAASTHHGSELLSHGRGRGYRNGLNDEDDNDNKKEHKPAPGPISSAPAHISPGEYSNFVKTYSWPSKEASPEQQGIPANQELPPSP